MFQVDVVEVVSSRKIEDICCGILKITVSAESFCWFSWLYIHQTVSKCGALSVSWQAVPESEHRCSHNSWKVPQLFTIFVLETPSGETRSFKVLCIFGLPLYIH